MKSSGNGSSSHFSIPVKAFLLLSVFFFLRSFSHPFPVTAPSSSTSLNPTTSSSLPLNSIELDCSTFFGGSGPNSVRDIAVDAQGNSYITGSTQSSNFPTKSAFNSTYGGGNSWGDAFVAKFDSSGNLVFNTFLGGSNNDYGINIAVDSLGNSYITGWTNSSNFPTKSAFNSTFGGGQDLFFAKFDSFGNLIFSTFLGCNGDDIGTSIACYPLPLNFSILFSPLTFFILPSSLASLVSSFA